MPDDLVELLDPDGNVAYRKVADVPKALGQGYTQRTVPQQVAGAVAAGEEKFFTSPEQKLKAFAGSAIDAATLGGGSLLERLTDGTAAVRETRLGREYNEGLSLAGAVVGGVGGAVTAGPAALASKVGQAAGKKLGGGIAATGAGLALEGGAQGAGQAVQELSLSDDPVTFEHALSTIGTGALVGGALGGGLGIVGKAGSKVFQRSKALVDDLASKTAPSGFKAADELTAYQAASAGDNSPWLIAESSETRTALRETRNAFKREARDLVGLEENPAKLLKPLRQEAQAIRTAIKEANEGLTAKLAKEEVQLAADLGERIVSEPDGVLLTGKLKQRYTDWSGVTGPRAGIKIDAPTGAAFKAALEAGEVGGKRAKALAAMPDLLAKNEALQASIKAAADVGSESGGLLGKLAGKAIQGAGMSVAAGMLPGGPVGAIGMMIAPEAIGKLKELVLGRLTKAGAESALRSAKALETFVSTSKKISRAAPVLASKTLASVSYAPAKATATAKPTVAGSSPLVAAYRDREAELRSQTVAAPDGSIVMTPSARAKVNENLRGVAAVSPQFADQIESLAARRIEFLASKLPKRPDIYANPIGPDRWQPSDYDMRTFARYAAAVEDPGAVEERLADGSVTPEDVEAYKAVYPERFAAFQQQLIEQLPLLRESLPYERRVALSIFSEVPVDAAMNPQILAVLQGMYTDEPNSDGGMSAPVAAPQFGSVSKPEATAAQKRAG